MTAPCPAMGGEHASKSAERRRQIGLSVPAPPWEETAAIAANTSILFPPWRERQSLKDLLGAIESPEETLRFVGGCVRDTLMGLPVKDIDLATPHSPEAIAQMVTAAGFKTVPVGRTHGTVRVLIGRETYEITTLRKDTQTNGRHAKVSFITDWDADAARRDFTCNALYLSPRGQLYDPFGGYEDLKAGRLRFIGDPNRRLKEDYLRILRFFRFYGRFGQRPPEEAALQALMDHRQSLQYLSRERVTGEIQGILSLPTPLGALELMEQTLVLEALFGPTTQRALVGTICALQSALPPPLPRSPDWLLRLAALLPPGIFSSNAPLPGESGPNPAACFPLRLSNKDLERLKQLLAYKQPLHQENPPHGATVPLFTPAGVFKFFYRHGVQDGIARVLLQEALFLHQEQRAPSPDRLVPLIAALKTWRPKTFPLTGEDALERGLTGPTIGRLLKAVEAWWIGQGGSPTRTACLEKLDQILIQQSPPDEAN